eukprot:5952697-Prymnesium_polylepis.1
MEATWASDTAVSSDRIVEDILRFPAALEAIIAAKGAKVPELDNRRGRRKTRPRTREFEPARIEAVEAHLKERYEALDPMPALPPKKRKRS